MERIVYLDITNSTYAIVIYGLYVLSKKNIVHSHKLIYFDNTK